MIGIIVQLAISLGLIWLIEKKDLSVLGLRPNKRRLIDFFAFFIVTAVFCSLGFVLKNVLRQSRMAVESSALFIPCFKWNLVEHKICSI